MNNGGSFNEAVRRQATPSGIGSQFENTGTFEWVAARHNKQGVRRTQIADLVNQQFPIFKSKGM